jgi:hypothetical protein
MTNKSKRGYCGGNLLQLLQWVHSVRRFASEVKHEQVTTFRSNWFGAFMPDRENTHPEAAF